MVRLTGHDQNSTTDKVQYDVTGTPLTGNKFGVDVVLKNPSTAPVYITEVPFTTFLTGDVSGSTTEVEAKVDSSALASRRVLVIQNVGSTDFYVGPTGVDAGGTTDPGIVVRPGGHLYIRGAEANLAHYIIGATSWNAVVWEKA